MGDPRVEVFEHGLATDWGSWELVEATLRSFEHVRRRADPALVVLVSGQDYPVRRLVDWEAEVLAAGRWVGAAEELRYTPHWGRRRGEGQDTLTRYTHRWFQTPLARRGIRLGGRIGRLLRRVRGGVALRTEPLLSVRVVTRGRGVFWGIRRRTPFSPERPCYSGSQWVALRPTRSWITCSTKTSLPVRSSAASTGIRSSPTSPRWSRPLSWQAEPSGFRQSHTSSWDPALDQPTVCTLDDLDELVRSGSAVLPEGRLGHQRRPHGCT